MSRTTRRVLTVLGVLAGVGVVGFVGYGVARAAARPSTPRYPPAPGAPPVPASPLRPSPAPAGAPPPGPLASRLGDLMDTLSDRELEAVRNSLPANWWPYIGLATQAPDDASLASTLRPVGVEIGRWSQEQLQQLQKDLLASIGFRKALVLKGILEDAGVL